MNIRLPKDLHVKWALLHSGNRFPILTFVLSESRFENLAWIAALYHFGDMLSKFWHGVIIIFAIRRHAPENLAWLLVFSYYPKACSKNSGMVTRSFLRSEGMLILRLYHGEIS